jgi:hypothetical protein
MKQANKRLGELMKQFKPGFSFTEHGQLRSLFLIETFLGEQEAPTERTGCRNGSLERFGVPALLPAGHGLHSCLLP